MRLQRTAPGTNRRRGIILLVVLIMLTLFAIAGVTFVLYANNAAVSGGQARDAESFTVSSAPDMDPTTSFNLFLGQLIYGVPDPTAANNASPDSALRGHSLAENMYGGYDSLGVTPSDVPDNGTGWLNQQYPIYGADNATVSGQTDSTLVNYTYFSADNFLRDPSRPGTRTGPSAARTTYTGGQNPPYTYPDTNCMFLASINQTTGQVTTPSFFRNSAGFGSLAPNNPNWTTPSPALKYLTLRPRPGDSPAFPPPASATGDVQNLSTSSGPDAIWIDIGAPELYTASGLRYKMLVAPTVLDLDNRINLNAVGNVFASAGGAGGNLHAGNQAWGGWEVNMWRALNANPTEWQNVFLGGNGVLGRYGSGGLPSSFYAFNGVAPHVYFPGDLNGVQDPGSAGAFTPTQAWTLPTGVAGFPTFPTGYGNNAPQPPTYPNGVELYNASNQIAHPMFYDPLHNLPSGGAGNTNRMLPLYNHAVMMYAGPAAAANFDLAKLCPLNFNPTDANTIRRIHETTLLSMDFDRAGAAPYFYDPNNANYSLSYNLGTGQYAYSGAPQSFPPLTSRPNPTPPVSDFDPTTWRSILPRVLTRTDLDRPLQAYSATNGWAQPPDRQVFAMDIFTRLQYVTGMVGIYNNGNPSTASAQQYATLRWLAQLSANIVDYIDTDDVMTVFQWATTPQGSDTGYVFGTELPKLVVNEIYLEYDNDSNDPGMVQDPNNANNKIKGATQAYHMNVWAELLNPLPDGADGNGPNANNANLVSTVTNSAAYQLVLTKPNQGIRNADNTLGNPDGPTPPNAPYDAQPYSPTGNGNYNAAGQVISVVNNWGAVQNVQPVGTTANGTPGPGGASVKGYLVVGPSPNPAGPLTAAQQVQIQPSLTSAGMTYTVNNDANGESPTPPTLMLQRLANPNIAFNATTNPWVTVDYIDASQIANTSPATATPPNTYTNTYTRPVNTANPPATAQWYPVVNDARQYNAYGNNPNFVSSPNARTSYGRMEPYAAIVSATTAAVSQWQAQNVTGTGNLPTSTFFAQNSPATQQNGSTAYHWLVHMDRPLISPIELTFVSGFKPHELTQEFIGNVNNTATPYHHVAPWTDQSGASLLYRFAEFTKVKNTSAGVMAGGRIPGRININTVNPNAKEVFEGLCDAEPGNHFTNATVDQLFQTLMAQRTPSGTPAPGDQPFWGMAPGTAAGGDAMGNTPRGLNQTLLASALSSTGAGTPYQNLELLNKIYNNTTTRSNVFAVWLTVGFFQVVNDQTTPMMLGPEINAAQGKNIRHHMFAIVDRTQITTFTTKTTAPITANLNANTATWTPQAISVPTSVTDARTGVTWNIGVGSTLVYDQGTTNEETVVVQAGIVAPFTLNHAAGAAVVNRGNPGQWTTYNVSADGRSCRTGSSSTDADVSPLPRRERGGRRAGVPLDLGIHAGWVAQCSVHSGPSLWAKRNSTNGPTRAACGLRPRAFQPQVDHPFLLIVPSTKPLPDRLAASKAGSVPQPIPMAREVVQ